MAAHFLYRVDADHHPCQAAVRTPDGRLVGGAASALDEQLLLARGRFVYQPRVWPSVGQPLRGIAEDLGRGVVHFDDRAFVVGHEEPLLQRIHQRGTEFVTVGQILGASPLLRVAPGAVNKAASGDIKRRQRLQQEFQCYRRIDPGVFRDLQDQLDVMLDDVEHADLFFQGPASELISDGQAVLVARVQVGKQRSGVVGMEVVGVDHVDTPR